MQDHYGSSGLSTLASNKTQKANDTAKLSVHYLLKYIFELINFSCYLHCIKIVQGASL